MTSGVEDTTANEQSSGPGFVPENEVQSEAGQPTREKKRATPAQEGRGLFAFDLKFWILVCALCVLYISMRNYYDKLWRQEQELEEEVKNLRSESITLNAKLMRTSKESEVAKLVEERQLELQESRRPPIRIKYYER